ncbi:GNAT family N-acetyltransferase [Arthrobacter sp. Soc17.1.1.1]|uniref:GNAT family N-acetyltransferase n=1 Tax=Arthrobacter sp. Soc17.1.1.1 TaxID=3121277 RepID=UPI002FE49F7C
MQIVQYEPAHRAALLALSIRAWEPVFPLFREAVAPFVYESFYPDGWRERQVHDLAAVLDGEPRNVAVALEEDLPLGWVCTRFHADDSMSEIYVLAVDPEFQRRGVARALMDHSFDRGREAGMRMVLVETGDDPGHEPARRAYEAAGFERWPVARYFKDLSGQAATAPWPGTTEDRAP